MMMTTPVYSLSMSTYLYLSRGSATRSRTSEMAKYELRVIKEDVGMLAYKGEGHSVSIKTI